MSIRSTPRPSRRSAAARRAPVALACATVATLSLAAAALLAPAQADASGLAVARFGGEHGNPTESNPAALYYNPAGIAFSDGTHIMLDVNLALRTASYTRPASAVGDGNRIFDDPQVQQLAIDANSGEATLSNVIASPMFGITTDFGLDAPFAVGLAFYAPFGGASQWDQVDAIDRFPGAEDGPQRWSSIDGTLRTLALTLGAAYKIEPIRLSIGFGGNLLLSEIDTVRARNSDGTDTLESEDGRLIEGRSRYIGDSVDFSFGAGLMWEPIEEQLWIGLSYQSAPNIDGEFAFEGTLTNLLATQPEPSDSENDLIQSYPDVFRLGARFRPMDDLELRLFGDFIRWSKFDQQCLIASDAADPDAFCETNPDGSLANENNTVSQIFRRDWEDAFGIRVGASWWAMERLELIAGAGWDGNAIPDETLDPALFDMAKVSAALGAKYDLTDWVAFMLTGTNIFYLERDTSGTATNNRFVPPTRQPSSAGVYSQNIFVLNTNFEFAF